MAAQPRDRRGSTGSRSVLDERGPRRRDGAVGGVGGAEAARRRGAAALPRPVHHAGRGPGPHRVPRQLRRARASTTASCRCPCSAAWPSSRRRRRTARCRGPPDLVARYSRFDVANTWRNLTMTPDFPSLAVAANELYQQSGGQPINGVISVDPAGLAALMGLLDADSVQVDGPRRAAHGGQRRGLPAQRPVHRLRGRQRPAARRARRHRADHVRRPHRRRPEPGRAASASCSIPSSTGATSCSPRSDMGSFVTLAQFGVRRCHAGARPRTATPWWSRRRTPAATRSTSSCSAASSTPSDGIPPPAQVTSTLHGHARQPGAGRGLPRLHDRQRRRPAAGHQPLVRLDLQPVRPRGCPHRRPAGGAAVRGRAGLQRLLDVRRHPVRRSGGHRARPRRVHRGPPLRADCSRRSRSPRPTRRPCGSRWWGRPRRAAMPRSTAAWRPGATRSTGSTRSRSRLPGADPYGGVDGGLLTRRQEDLLC